MTLLIITVLIATCQGTGGSNHIYSTTCQMLSRTTDERYESPAFKPRPSSEELDEALKDIRRATDLYYLWVMTLLMEEVHTSTSPANLQVQLRTLLSTWFSMAFQEQVESLRSILHPLRFSKLKEANADLIEFHQTMTEYFKNARARSEAAIHREPPLHQGTHSLDSTSLQVRKPRTGTRTRAAVQIIHNERDCRDNMRSQEQGVAEQVVPGASLAAYWPCGYARDIHTNMQYQRAEPDLQAARSDASTAGAKTTKQQREHPRHVTYDIMHIKKWRSRGWCRKLPHKRMHRSKSKQGIQTYPMKIMWGHVLHVKSVMGQCKQLCSAFTQAWLLRKAVDGLAVQIQKLKQLLQFMWIVCQLNSPAHMSNMQLKPEQTASIADQQHTRSSSNNRSPAAPAQTQNKQIHSNSTTPSNCTRSGPKSAGNGHKHKHTYKQFKWITLAGIFGHAQPIAGVRVPDLPEESGGVVTNRLAPLWNEAAKHFGERAKQKQPGNWITKRAYKRACNRANLTGQTRYKGRILSADQLRAEDWRNKAETQHSRRESLNARIQYPRVSVLTINIGGLNAGLFDELKIYANQSKYQVIHIQETKWRFESEWQDNNWKFIHSGSSKEGLKQGGLLTMIHNSMADRVECAHIIPGRLLHVRIYGGDAAFDCINCYNYVYAKDKQSMSRRASFWQALARTLDDIPLRNTIMMAGDFNTPHHPHRGYCGHGVLPQKNTEPEDASDFTRILEVYNLCLTNTWQTKMNPATFDFQRFQSQIDFIIVRRQLADQLSKQARPLREFLPTVRREGAKHKPIATSIRIRWRPWHLSQTRRQQVDTEGMIQDMNMKKPPARLCSFRDSVEQTVQQAQMLDEVGESLLQVAVQYYPKQTTQPKRPFWQNPSKTVVVYSKWDAFKQMRRYNAKTLHNLFNAWRYYWIYQRMEKASQKVSKQLRKQALQDDLQEATDAANRHDFRTLYKIINKLAPKTQRKPVRLKKTNGSLMDPEQEACLFEKHFKDRFNTQDESELKLHNQTWQLESGVNITEEEIRLALLQTPLRKAGPPSEAPSAAWRAAASEVAHITYEALREQWKVGILTIPQRWSDTFLALIPKPGKQGDDPAHFRPIGLLSHLGKAIMGVLVKRIQPKVQSYLEGLPQYAYVKYRTYKHALRRAFNHCHQVRELCERERRTLHDKFQGYKQRQCVGGLMICADLAQAFDRVPRGHLQQAMLDAGFLPDEIAIFMLWHTQSRCHIQHKSHTKIFPTTQGVRQGCKAAPTLFILYSGYFMKKANQKLGPDWVTKALSAYADDHLFYWKFESLVELNRAVEELAFCWQLFEGMGMQISAHKCQAVFTYRGTLADQVRKKYTRKAEQGSMFRFRTGNRIFEIPMNRHTGYLGAVISYENYEDLTLTHRMQRAQTTYWDSTGF